MSQPTTPGPDHYGWTHGVPGRATKPPHEFDCPECGVQRTRAEWDDEVCHECLMGIDKDIKAAYEEALRKFSRHVDRPSFWLRRNLTRRFHQKHKKRTQMYKRKFMAIQAQLPPSMPRYNPEYITAPYEIKFLASFV